ncbi:calcium-dependent phosphotriesterase [Pleurostoma richardsiae]|uniref:Calcium-dependent phosphotriesterase n=1 Tax=Pleurostoma richardsiae TaxID=41990 RepID=A0AA38VL29_9PEZI|nr:calcium-dependent phosphotriesterase [Pleurostoma richardsiae]
MAQQFETHDADFAKILGPCPSLDLLLEDSRYPFAHEAGVYLPSRDELFITSNRFCDPGSQEQRVQISKVAFKDGVKARHHTTREEIDSTAIPMGNGGVNYGEDSILFCAQGSHRLPSGLYAMKAESPHEVSLVLSHYHRRPFNSVNDVVIHSDGSIWFTDPHYGFEQGYRPEPQLPSQVYRYDPTRKATRAMVDGLGHPNGICFSPDEKTLYVTDTDWLHGSGTTHDSRASTIYAFDVAFYHGGPFLVNRRLFAMADTGIPDGIKCDMEGNVYSGCGDGINVWSPAGVLLGKILVEGGAANFCFGREGEMFILNETRLWRAQLGTHVRGALLGI